MNASETAFRSRWQMTVTALAPNHFRAPSCMLQRPFHPCGRGGETGIGVVIAILDPIIIESLVDAVIDPVPCACEDFVFHLLPPWKVVSGDANLSPGRRAYNTQLWVISAGK